MCRTCSARSSTRSARPRSRIRRARCCCSTAARRCRACRSTSPRSAADFYAFSGAQALRPDRHRLPVGPRRAARRDAAVAGRRGDDRQGHVREDHLPRSAGAVRGGHAAHRRRGRAARRGRLGRAASASTRSTRTNARWSPRRATRCRSIHGVTLLRARGQRRHRQLQRRRGASARHRHHIGRCGRRGPRRPPLRAAADGRLGVDATARASFAAHSDSSDIEALVRGIEQVKRIFG